MTATDNADKSVSGNGAMNAAYVIVPGIGVIGVIETQQRISVLGWFSNLLASGVTGETVGRRGHGLLCIALASLYIPAHDTTADHFVSASERHQLAKDGRAPSAGGTVHPHSDRVPDL